MARDAPIAIIFRRGPTKWVQLIRWRTDTDECETGQWFHGRIHERRSDLSPSGEYLIYSAQKYNQQFYNHDFGYAWTAVSKPPYFTALAIWPNISAGFGGGVFDTEHTGRIWYPFDNLAPHPDFSRPRHMSFTQEWLGSSYPDPKVQYLLNRDGWKLVQAWKGEFVESEYSKRFAERIRSGEPADPAWKLTFGPASTRSGYATYAPQIREKQHFSGALTLVMQTSLNRFEEETVFSIRNCRSGEVHPISGAEWADWDQAGRLVFVTSGKLFAGEIGEAGVQRRELADFNENKFEEVQAPEWATNW